MAGQCAWSGATTAFILSVGTDASIQEFADPAEPNSEAKLAAFEQRAGETGTAESVDGVGDGAVVGDNGMAARAGGTYLEIEKLALGKDQLIELMRAAVAGIDRTG